MWRVSQAVRQVTKYTRHVAGTKPHVLVSPFGWVRWSGVVEQLEGICQSDITEHMFLTNMVTSCCGGIHVSEARRDARYYRHHEEYDSWEEPAVRAGTKKGRVLVLCDDGSGNTIVVRAQHGMSANIGVAVSVNHVAFPISALQLAPTFCHMTTISTLSFIVLSGPKSGT